MTDSSSASSLAQFYQSLPLNTGSQCIRVLHLEVPNPNEADGGALHGDLRIIDLAAVPIPGFTALSYVCGNIEDASPSSVITLGPNRFVLQLTNNCHEALKYLRSIVRSLTIWVDAISIYQSDVGEKNHQIPLMGEIYARAETTFIWLGPADEACGRAIKRLSNIGLLDCFFRATLQNVSGLLSSRTWQAARALFRGANNMKTWRTNFSRASQNDLIHFLDSQYLHRLWTYQEVMLSRRPVIVRGNVTITWPQFVMSILYLSDRVQHYDGSRVSNVLRLWRSLVLDRHKLEDEYSSDRLGLSLADDTRDLKLYHRFRTEIGHAARRYGNVFHRVCIFACVLGLVAGFGLAVHGITTASPKLIGVGFGLVGVDLVVSFASLLIATYLSGRTVRFEAAKEAELWSAQNTVLSAIWSRQCKEPQDVNFATRNIVRTMMGTELAEINYSSPLGDVYRDLTANMLRLTGNPELILAALRSDVIDAPSWTIDWFMRQPLRIFPGEFERYYDLFYDSSASPMTPGSWRLEPARPDVLQIQGQSLGRVRAVIEIQNPENAIEQDQSAAHVHNFKVLSILAVADSNSLAPKQAPRQFHVSSYMQKFLLDLLSDMCAQGRGSPENILPLHFKPPWRSLNKTTLIKPNSNWSEVSGLRGLISRYNEFCAWMRNKRIILLSRVSGDTTSMGLQGDFISQLTRDKVLLAKTLPVTAPASSNDCENILGSPFQGCGIRPGDMVVHVQGLADEKAVMRELEGDSFMFVDAVEFLLERFRPGQFGDSGEMRFFDII